MSQQLWVEARTLSPDSPTKHTPREQQAELRLYRLLMAVVALACSSLEIELLEQIDALSLYMAFKEILLDFGVALLLLVAASMLWWLVLLLVLRLGNTIPQLTSSRVSFVWRIGLAVPLSYFMLDLFGSIRLRIAPNWYPGLYGWLCLGVVCISLGVGSVYLVRLDRLQEFCKTRLVPVGYLHLFAAGAVTIALCMHGAIFFRNFENPIQSASTAQLPDIYLITIDALRADETSVYGYTRPTTPNLEQFDHRSTTFDYFFSNSNFTTPATVSIETGKLPWSHRVFQFGGFLRSGDQRQNIAELLRERGFYTAIISDNFAAMPFRHRTVGSYDAVEYSRPNNISGRWMELTNVMGLNTQQTLSGSILKRLGGVRMYLDALLWSKEYPSKPQDVFNRARALIERQNNPRQPRFLWTHIYAPHDPYLPPLPFRGRFLSSDKLTRNYNFIGLRNTTLPAGVSASELRARYDESIESVDHALGEYLGWLDETGRLDRSIVIVSADHGESFEHGWFLHAGPYLYNSVIHIPLLIHLPGQREGSRIQQPVQQVDLLPTLLDLVGAPIPSWTDGRSLKPLLEGQTLPQKPVFSMNLESNSVFAPISKGTLAIVDDEFKYVTYLGLHRDVLYRYRKDESENFDLSAEEPKVVDRMRAVVAERVRVANEALASKQ